MEKVSVNGGEIEYETRGDGEPVLLIHGGGVAATFLPMMSEPALAGYELIRYHRRGYAGSSARPIPNTVEADAADARALLHALGVSRAHLAGHSYGGAVALQLAIDAPDLVQSICSLEGVVPFPADFKPPAGVQPPARQTAPADAADSPELQAISGIMALMFGSDWKTVGPRMVPGVIEQVLKDTANNDGQIARQWRPSEDALARITQPLLTIAGSRTLARNQPIDQVVRNRSLELFPDGEWKTVDGAGHDMITLHPKPTAEAIAAFLKRHPM